MTVHQPRCAAALALLSMLLAHDQVLAQVPYQRLLRAETEPANWMTYAGNYQSHRHSQLNQINRETSLD